MKLNNQQKAVIRTHLAMIRVLISSAESSTEQDSFDSLGEQISMVYGSVNSIRQELNMQVMKEAAEDADASTATLDMRNHQGRQ